MKSGATTLEPACLTIMYPLSFLLQTTLCPRFSQSNKEGFPGLGITWLSPNPRGNAIGMTELTLPQTERRVPGLLGPSSVGSWPPDSPSDGQGSVSVAFSPPHTITWLKEMSTSSLKTTGQSHGYSELQNQRGQDLNFNLPFLWPQAIYFISAGLNLFLCKVRIIKICFLSLLKT